MLSGRNWVIEEERRLNEAFERARGIDGLGPLSADLSRYLVILVAGWMEQSAFELARDRCRRDASGPVLSFSLSHLDRTRNARLEELLDMVGRFDKRWRDELERFMTSEKKDAINSIMGLRNQVAHGNPWIQNASVARVSNYFESCRTVIYRIADILYQ